MFRHAVCLPSAVLMSALAMIAPTATSAVAQALTQRPITNTDDDRPAPEQPLIPDREPVPRPAPSRSGPNLPDHLAQGTWAIGTVANCANARKRYSLTVTGNTVTWRDGTGNIDVEEILSMGTADLSTRTVKSDHGAAREVKRGTTWSYAKISADTVQVTPSDKNQFTIVRCR